MTNLPNERGILDTSVVVLLNQLDDTSFLPPLTGRHRHHAGGAVGRAACRND